MPVATSKAASIVSTTPEKITHLTPPMMKSLEEKKGLADADVVKCEKNLADESKAYQEAKEAAEKAKMDKENAKKTAMEDNKDVDPNEDSDNEYHLTRTVQIEKNIVIDVAADGTETETCTENEVVTEKWEIIHHEHDGDHHEETVAAKSLYEGCTKVAKIAAKEEEAAANAAAAHLKDAEKALAEARSAFAAAEKILAAEKEEMRLAQEELEAAQKLAADLAAQLAAATEQSAADEKASEELLALIKEVRDNQSKDAKTLCAIVIKLEVCIDITCSAHMTVLAEASVEELMVSIKVATDDKALIAACVAVIAKCKQAAENLEGEEKATLAEIHDLLDKIKRNPDASPEEMSAWINDLGALLDVENPKHQNLLEKAGCKDLMQKIKDNTDDENVKAACDGVIAKCDEAEKAAEEALKAKQESNKELKAAIDLVRDNQDADPKELAKMIEAMADMIDVNCHDHAFILDHELAKELLESIMENTDDEDLKAACKKALGLVSEAKDNEHEREAADKAAIRELIHKIETNPDASPEEMAKWVHELTDLLDAENPAHQDILAESNCKDLMQKIKDNTDDEILKAACDEAIEICEEAEKEAAEAAAAAEKEVEELLAAINAVKDNKDADAKTLTPLVKTLADLIDASSHGQFTVLEGEHVKSLIDDIKRNTDDEDLLAACDAVLEKLNLSEKHAAEAEEDMLEGINALLDEIEAKKDTATPEELAAMCHALKDLIDEDNSNVADLLDKRNVKDLMQDIIDNTDDEYLKAAAGGVIEKCDEAAANAAEELKAQQESNKELKAAIDLVRDNQDADPKELAKMVAAMEDLIDVNCHDHAFILDHELARELLQSIMENTDDEDLKAACQKCLDKVVEAKDNEHERETKDKNAIRELIHQIESNPDASPEQMAKWIHKLVDLVDPENPAHQDILAETNCKDLVQKVMDNTDDEGLKASCKTLIDLCDEAEKDAAEAAAAAEKEVEELLAAINAVKDNKMADAKTLTPLVKTLADLIDASSHGQFTVLEGEHVKHLIEDIKRMTDDADLIAACDEVIAKCELSEKHAAEAKEEAMDEINALLDEIEAKKDTATPEELAAMCHALKDLIDEDDSDFADLLDKRNVKDLMQDIIDNTDDEYLKAAAGGVIEKCDAAAEHAAEAEKEAAEKAQQISDLVQKMKDGKDTLSGDELAAMTQQLMDLIDEDDAGILDLLEELDVVPLLKEIAEAHPDHKELQDLTNMLLEKIISAEQDDKAAKYDSRTELRAAIFELEENLDASPEELARMIKAINDIVDINDHEHQKMLEEHDLKAMIAGIKSKTNDEDVKKLCDELIEKLSAAEDNLSADDAAEKKSTDELDAAFTKIEDNKDGSAKDLIKFMADAEALIDCKSMMHAKLIETNEIIKMLTSIMVNTEDEDLRAACKSLMDKCDKCTDNAEAKKAETRADIIDLIARINEIRAAEKDEIDASRMADILLELAYLIDVNDTTHHLILKQEGVVDLMHEIMAHHSEKYLVKACEEVIAKCGEVEKNAIAAREAKRAALKAALTDKRAAYEAECARRLALGLELSDFDPNDGSDAEYHLLRVKNIKREITIEVAADGTETETVNDIEEITETWDIIMKDEFGNAEHIAAKSLNAGAKKAASRAEDVGAAKLKAAEAAEDAKEQQKVDRAH